MKIQRRRGVALLPTIMLVMLLLTIISLGLMGLTHVNMRSAEQEYFAMRARVAAQSVLSALGDKAEAALKTSGIPLSLWEITDGNPAKGSFTDDGFDFQVTVASNNKAYLLTCEARRDVPNAPVVKEQMEITCTLNEEKTALKSVKRRWE